MKKRYKPKQKAQIVLEILKEERTVTQISSEYAKCLIGDPDADFPVLGPETTEDDLKEALWVIQREQRTEALATTWIDFQMHLDGHDVGDMWSDDLGLDDMPLSQLSAGMDRTTHITAANLKIKEGIEKARKRKKTEEGVLEENIRTAEVRDDVRAWVTARLKAAREDSRVTNGMIQRWQEDVDVAFDRLWNEVDQLYPTIDVEEGDIVMGCNEGSGNSPIAHINMVVVENKECHQK